MIDSDETEKQRSPGQSFYTSTFNNVASTDIGIFILRTMVDNNCQLRRYVRVMVFILCVCVSVTKIVASYNNIIPTLRAKN